MKMLLYSKIFANRFYELSAIQKKIFWYFFEKIVRFYFFIKLFLHTFF